LHDCAGPMMAVRVVLSFFACIHLELLSVAGFEHLSSPSFRSEPVSSRPPKSEWHKQTDTHKYLFTMVLQPSNLKTPSTDCPPSPAWPRSSAPRRPVKRPCWRRACPGGTRSRRRRSCFAGVCAGRGGSRCERAPRGRRRRPGAGGRRVGLADCWRCGEAEWRGSEWRVTHGQDERLKE